uniref:NADH-ubiquinone oxidoreductase chain 3 n=1 Tax=Aegilops tauschii subsp. strangulata TaxID=200361 RepID=A0A453P828_AEGTS
NLTDIKTGVGLRKCGSDPTGDARSRFGIQFYQVLILFIIPDPEVTFSFPWAVPPNKIGLFGTWLWVLASQSLLPYSKILPAFLNISLFRD